MDMKEFLDYLDILFEEKKLDEVEPFLDKSLTQAVREIEITVNTKNITRFATTTLAPAGIEKA